MTSPEAAPRKPRTLAGRQLLTALPLTEWHPMNTEFLIDHILAIEAEAAAGTALDVERLARALFATSGFTYPPEHDQWDDYPNVHADYLRDATAIAAEYARLAGEEK